MKRFTMKELVPSDEYLEACLKLFTRFLKERGQYKMVMNYLFYPGRKKEEFFYKVKNMYCGVGRYEFGDILHLIPVLGGEEDENNWRFRCGVNYFNTIEDVSCDFIYYWRDHCHEIKVPFNKYKKTCC